MVNSYFLEDAYSITIAIAYVLPLIFLLLYLKPFLTPRARDTNGNPVPKGPLGLPIVGSFFSLTSYPELTLHRWAKKFGPLYSLWLGDTFFVIISDPQIAKDLMVTNGVVFSSRKEMFIKSQTILAPHGGIAAAPYGDRWRNHRRIAVGYLSSTAVESYTHVLDYEASVLVKNLYQRGKGGTLPINPQPHAGRCSLNNMLTIVFGTRTDSIDHPLVAHALNLSREFMNCTGPMSNLVDFVPFLQGIPGIMRTRGRKLHKALVDTYGSMITDIRERLNRGEDVPDCLSKSMILIQEEEKLDHLDMAILASAFMIGGVETTASIMQWFCALIPAYPEIQAKAHEELDRVVGRKRLPTAEDEKNMPYMHAIVKEVERCHNPFWLGTPHSSTEDFTYKGQFIPKDTVLVVNTYTMHNDPNRHTAPQMFNPDRYLNDHTLSSQSVNSSDPYARDHWIFGAGRRICPGIFIAEREIWLAISHMLWAFRMEEIAGEPIDLKEYDGLSGRSPVPFRIRMIPRDENVAKVLEI